MIKLYSKINYGLAPYGPSYHTRLINFCVSHPTSIYHLVSMDVNQNRDQGNKLIEICPFIYLQSFLILGSMVSVFVGLLNAFAAFFSSNNIVPFTQF